MNNAEHILKDLCSIVGELDGVLTQLAGKAGEQVEASVAEVQSRFGSIRERVHTLASELERKARQTADATDRSVRRHPWEALAIAAVTGFLVGLAVRRQG